MQGQSAAAMKMALVADVGEGKGDCRTGADAVHSPADRAAAIGFP